MKYADAQEMANDLESFASFIREHGHELPGHIHFGTSTSYLYDDDSALAGGTTAKEKAKKAAKVLAKGGLVEKKHDNYSLDLIRRFGRVRLTFSINREKFCTKVVTGTKQVEEYHVPAHTEDTFEWVCDDPVLAG